MPAAAPHPVRDSGSAPLVAALDLATTCGVAIGAPRGRAEHYTVRLGEGAARGASIIRLVTDLVVQRRITHLAVEAPLLVMGGKAGATVMRVLVGMAAVAQAAAALSGVEHIEIEVSTIRKHFCGHAPKRDRAKAVVMERCRLLGYAPATDHEADAIALWDCALSRLSPMHAAVASGALFGRRP